MGFLLNFIFNWFCQTVEEKLLTLENLLKGNLFGQHIAIEEVFVRLKQHFKKENPSKPLVIICNGSLGTGKTYFANFIKTSLFGRNCVVYFGPKDFPSSSQLHNYQSKLKTEIEAAVKRNPRTFFIFDDVDKAPIGLLDTVTPYAEWNANYGGVDYTKCVFMFISNNGGQRIDEIVSRQITEGKERQKLTLFNFRKILEEISFAENGGLQGSTIISKRLIDLHVPFLPLEKEHIYACVKAEYEKIKDSFNDKCDLKAVTEMFSYYPMGNSLFAVDGAKNVNITIQEAMTYVNQNWPLPTRG